MDRRRPAGWLRRVDPRREPLLAALGPVGRTPDWLAQQLGLPPPRLLAEVARLEAAGRVRREGGLVIPAEIR